jgi:hypothetical protein
MTEVEELLRETLADPRRRLDPDPQQYERISATASGLRRQRTRRRAAGALAAVAVLALLVTVGTVVDRQGSGPPPAAGRSAVPRAPAERIAAAGGCLYVLTATSLRRVDTTMRVAASVRLPWHVTRNPGLAADDSSVWVWSTTSDGRLALAEYSADRLTPLYHETVSVPYVFSGAAMNGVLWLGTQHGLYRVVPGATTQPVSGVFGDVFAVAADPIRNRVLIDQRNPGSGGTERLIVALDATTLIATDGAPVRFGKDSIAVVGNDIWVAGYSSVPTSKLTKLNTRTLDAAGSSPIYRKLGPGAIVWPGQTVLWVRAGGNENLYCVDPSSGRVLQKWAAVQGPVASMSGVALAVGDGTGSGGVSRLHLNAACTG